MCSKKNNLISIETNRKMRKYKSKKQKKKYKVTFLQQS